MVSQPQPISLYATARQAMGINFNPVLATKATLNHLSHTLEDIVVNHQLPAFIFTGFQKTLHWEQARKRYQALDEIARQIIVFVTDPLPMNPANHTLQIALAENDPLIQEWFVVILAPQYQFVLIGKDQKLSVTNDALRQFEILLTFEPSVISRVLDVLETVLNQKHPAQVPALQAARVQYQSQPINPAYFTSLVSDWIRFEEQLHQRFRQESDLNTHLLETTAVYVVRTRISGEVLTINDALLNALNITAGQVIGQTFWDKYIVESDRDTVITAMAQALTANTSIVFQASFINGDTSLRTVTWRLSSSLLNGDKQLVAVGVDMTERVRTEVLRESEDRMRKELEKTRALNEQRDRFITTLSQQLTDPLNILLTSAEMLELYHEKLSTDSRDKHVGRIKQQVFQIKAMLDDMSTAFKTSEGYITLQPALTDIVTQVAAVISDVKVAMLSYHNIAFENQWKAGSIYADAQLIRHILYNLLTNAIIFTPDTGKIVVSLAESRNRIVLEVMDEGSGIPEADQPHVFEAFFRGSNVRKEGTGSGLKIVYDCVQIYGGDISFISDENGTTFTVRLPILEG
jgi:signal transduction histidine kinase/DICT domain-containing protein